MRLHSTPACNCPVPSSLGLQDLAKSPKRNGCRLPGRDLNRTLINIVRHLSGTSHLRATSNYNYTSNMSLQRLISLLFFAMDTSTSESSSGLHSAPLTDVSLLRTLTSTNFTCKKVQCLDQDFSPKLKS